MRCRYTCVFSHICCRENGAVDPQTGEVYGFTLPDAVYRTNHGYDPVTQENYQVNRCVSSLATPF